MFGEITELDLRVLISFKKLQFELCKKYICISCLFCAAIRFVIARQLYKYYLFVCWFFWRKRSVFFLKIGKVFFFDRLWQAVYKYYKMNFNRKITISLLFLRLVKKKPSSSASISLYIFFVQRFCEDFKNDSKRIFMSNVLFLCRPEKKQAFGKHGKVSVFVCFY